MDKPSLQDQDSDCELRVSSYRSSRGSTTDTCESENVEEFTFYNDLPNLISNFSDPNIDCVVFSDIEEVYWPNKDITVKFSILKNVEMRRGDKIGLYPIACFHDQLNKECTASLPCFECTTTENFGFQVRSLTFSKTDLASVKYNHMYQFCYIDEDNRVLGRSTPFIFRLLTEEELVELPDSCSSPNESDGFVIVRSKKAILLDRLKQLSMNNGLLEYTKKRLIDEVNAKQSNIECLNKKQEEWEKRYTNLETKYKQLIEMSDKKMLKEESKLEGTKYIKLNDPKELQKKNEANKQTIPVCCQQQKDLEIELAKLATGKSKCNQALVNEKLDSSIQGWSSLFAFQDRKIICFDLII